MILYIGTILAMDSSRSNGNNQVIHRAFSESSTDGYRTHGSSSMSKNSMPNYWTASSGRMGSFSRKKDGFSK